MALAIVVVDWQSTMLFFAKTGLVGYPVPLVFLNVYPL